MTQRVSVAFGPGEKHYAYEWPGNMPLVIGDRVVCPPNWANADYSFATVVALTTAYEGELAALVGVVDQETGNVYYPNDADEPE